MTEGRFSGYELRTKDVAAGRAFYTGLFGDEFWDVGVSVVRLPEQAAARGAPSHWLGLIDTADVEDTAGRIVALGGQRLGPTRQHDDGSRSAALRDPFGTVVGVGSNFPANASSPVAWHLLHTMDHERAFALYADLFGWQATGQVDFGPALGSHQMFAWKDSTDTAGSVANSALMQHVHTHWQFYFSVPNIHDALARATALGAQVLAPVTAPGGATFAACDDPQGAAFGLFQPA